MEGRVKGWVCPSKGVEQQPGRYAKAVCPSRYLA